MLCVLAVFCLYFSSRKITYYEYRLYDVFSVTEIFRNGSAAEAMSCADEEGEPYQEILSNLNINIRPGQPLPMYAELYGRTGECICRMKTNTMVDFSAVPDAQSPDGSPAYSVVEVHIPFRMRPADPENCSLLLLDAADAPWNLSAIASFTWFGGDRDSFWIRLSVFFLLFSLIFLGRVIFLCLKKQCVTEDPWAMTMALTALSFAVMSILSSEFNPTVLDENDNIIGGMLQARAGYVMYRDYISQHTPLAYWLCALFASLGAKSFGQFRLLQALAFSLIFGGLFFRHRKKRFASAIALYAIFYGPVSYMFIQGNAGQILSDNIQAAAMAVMLTELMAYYEDHIIDAARAVIISLCIFASVGSAVMAVYAVFACMTAVILEEIRYFAHKTEKPSFFVRRYLLLAGCVLIPWIISVIYLGMNGAMQDFYDMAFRFNTEVYAKYSMPTTNPVVPLISGIFRIWELLSSTAGALLSGKIMPARILESGMMLVTIALLIRALFRRGFVQTLGLFFFIETQATRVAVQFHSIMLWSVVLMFLFMELPGMSCELISHRAIEVRKFFYICIILVFFGPSYFELGQNVWNYGDSPVPAAEISAVLATEEGEKIFVDGGAVKTDYLFYKGRYPITRLCWTLPWYYEWYGEEVKETLQREKPTVALYKTGMTVWGISDFSKETDKIIEEEYMRQGMLDLYVLKS